MGNPERDGAPAETAASIHEFYTASSWIEGAATEQLRQVANLPGVRQIAAFPDLHPGTFGPIGCAVLSERLYPQLIGNDIGCGMSLFALDLPRSKLRLDRAAQKLRVLESAWSGNAAGYLAEAGLPSDAFSEAIGSIGGGNHFCELQVIEEITDDAASGHDLAPQTLLLFVHSGSRGFGTHVFRSVVERFADGLEQGSTAANRYLDDHDRAVAWASLNRRIIALRAAVALRADIRTVVDSPHNVVERQGDLFLHRKGAAVATTPLVPLAGSRDSLSFLLKPTGCKPEALASLSHGSGRKYDRKSMLGRVGSTRSDRERLLRTSFGGRVICDDRQLLIEEAPDAYKNSAHVCDDLVSHGLATCVASLQPLITFKKATEPEGTESWKRQRKDHGRKWR
ncbi:RNA ligase RtcB family protein [Hoeflea sp. WL0058]|uniref:3'-phosphate/5'-hydroxy nucleic acid ligase n=1 Tax=Flavimaribacter sediminis TaxID=2865987 RepID=A0AAE2ZNC5_9HYPH|nr:RNA ligase RtcB family protein [Flavimaribacter sediminis]MBW8637720.1 RNA ligase RtcB family protein [Flavimaribacter sediminis]